MNSNNTCTFCRCDGHVYKSNGIVICPDVPNKQALPTMTTMTTPTLPTLPRCTFCARVGHSYASNGIVNCPVWKNVASFQGVISP